MIPFNKPYMTGKELHYIAQSHGNFKLAGDGPFTKLCHSWMETNIGVGRALLTHSCTAALEMAAILLDIKPGDEVIMPSYTFVSTANAFVLRGATPVFVDIREDTLNIDENLVEQAITPHTKAIVPVHYAGVSCEMHTLLKIAKRHGIAIVEDAAQAIMSTYKKMPLGSLGDFGTLSFHETKNVISGEGGALLVNDKNKIAPAEIIREKGTDRSRFFRGEVDKYTWQSFGSSFLPGELTAAFLWAQLEECELILNERLNSWRRYHSLLAPFEEKGLLRRPIIPEYCGHNGHIYYVLLPNNVNRDLVIEQLKKRKVNAVFHYVPLHSAPAGKKFGRIASDMKWTDTHSQAILRLPMWIGLTEQQQQYVVDTLYKILY
ncbi:dTDP-4-amino-4,6-dideoxygalactose transaminase [Alteromonas pelagimontana]|uniref:dTDP-4-amino-4,6-dideoxygalactose transaminase n=1 Tax=Alteromonas pelagimontana TaxID=1858656 RepID=A0A6M4MFI2_9ALTE|nr:dTDP-4-amino-4,6-dideoxygalactose transaminase [Alteromonas pelagimontana]QJR81842.1 dTDP-4-amino-4,6-dideoxygalactose transaminase [Alteromonas pelagimontana]